MSLFIMLCILMLDLCVYACVLCVLPAFKMNCMIITVNIVVFQLEKLNKIALNYLSFN